MRHFLSNVCPAFNVVPSGIVKSETKAALSVQDDETDEVTEETADDAADELADDAVEEDDDDDDTTVEDVTDEVTDDVATEELDELLELLAVPGFTMIVMAAGSLAAPAALYARTISV